MSTHSGILFAEGEKSYRYSIFKQGAEAHETKEVYRNVSSPIQEMASYITLQPWAPGIFKDKIRNKALLDTIEILALDVDEGCTLEQAKIIFADYKHIIGTSRSHGIEKNGVVCDRFRVILFLDKPVTTDSDFKQHWFAAYDKWPFIDKACKDSARFFFPCTKIVSINETGNAFTDRVSTPEAKSPTAPSKNNSNPAAKGRISRATKEFLIEGALPGEWHSTFFKAAIDFKEQGYAIEEARQQLTKAAMSPGGVGFLDDVDEKRLTDVYENRETKYAQRTKITNWPVTYINKEGNEVIALGHPDNVRHLIKEMGYRDLRLNQMDENIYNGHKYLTDQDISNLWVNTKEQGLQVSKDLTHAMITKIAMENSFHPIKDVIQATPWDNVDHIGALFKTLSFDEDSQEFAPQYEMYLRKWIVGIAAKIYYPGSQNLVLTFVGAQGIGKSRWLAKLALDGKVFGEGAVDPNNKDHELRHLTHLIWHIPELDYTTGRRETGALKDYLTRDTVSVRPAYARVTRHGRSICSFAASVNTTDFLVDQTGNRRFLIVPLESIDHNHTVNMQQVFAQAKALLDSGYQYWLSGHEIVDLNAHNEDFTIEDDLVAKANAVTVGSDEMTLLEIMVALGFENPSRSDITRFGSVLNKRGFKKRRRRLNGKQTRFFCVADPRRPKFGVSERTAGLVIPMIRQPVPTNENDVGAKKPNDIT